MDIFSLFAAYSIHPVVWSGIVASAITLLGVRFANKESARRQTEQHAFDALESQRERTLEMRRDVYMPISSEFSDVMSFFTTLYKSADFGNVDVLIKVLTSLSKVAIIGDCSTVVLASTLSLRISAAHSALVSAAEPATSALSRVAMHAANRERSFANVDEAMVECDKLLKSAANDEPRLLALQQNIETHLESGQQYLEKENSARRDHLRASIVFLTGLLEQLTPISVVAEDLLIALRGELNQISDETLIRRVAKEGRDANAAAISNVIKIMQAQDENWEN